MQQRPQADSAIASGADSATRENLALGSAGHSSAGGTNRGVVDLFLVQIATSPWALPVMFLLVLGDALFVILPGEVAVTFFGALAVSTGAPALWAVIVLATLGAILGDLCCYAAGRRIGLQRWRWMRAPRIQATFDWARQRLTRRTAVVLFTARFIPFARLAVNLTAGALRVPVPRYLLLVSLAAFAWASYQSLIGAVVATVVPGGPLVVALVSVVVAIGLGAGIDAVITQLRPRP